LDFMSGVGKKKRYGDTVHSRRVRAFSKLIERQRGKSFLLLVTLGLRTDIGAHLTQTLETVRRDVSDPDLVEALKWYEECGKNMQHYKLKAALPLFIRREAQGQGFDCCCYPPITYVGTGNVRMMHFVFRLVDTGAIMLASNK